MKDCQQKQIKEILDGYSWMHEQANFGAEAMREDLAKYIVHNLCTMIERKCCGTCKDNK